MFSSRMPPSTLPTFDRTPGYRNPSEGLARNLLAGSSRGDLLDHGGERVRRAFRVYPGPVLLVDLEGRGRNRLRRQIAPGHRVLKCLPGARIGERYQVVARLRNEGVEIDDRCH